MQVVIQTEITHRRICNACSMDEDADRGMYCECFEEDVPVEVVAEVGLDEEKSDYPFGKLSVAACIDILSVKETETGYAWGPADLLKEDHDSIQDALWSKYLETEPRMVLRKDVADLCESMKHYVALALESGTDPERVKAMLENAKRAIFDSRQGQEVHS